ncbi:hypothetical protein LIER_00487 [Lithospermum erythrorhizon]|uniref:Secreted protein n=1 Tax=Lithospermum erythrorhizon TaxID=34254 RepID=A0AAV3NK08_LITER
MLCPLLGFLLPLSILQLLMITTYIDTDRLPYVIASVVGRLFEDCVSVLRNRELLSHVDRHLVDSVASCRLLERNQVALSELAVIAHRVEFYASSIRALQTRQDLLDREFTAVDQTFRSTVAVAIHFSDLEGQLEA